ncbi:hypothetical protein PR048_024634 [Dryococelus australis]|uniref:RRM domain-containing protein n=1 Tax=Dryococelus australis TaxID=614101 RepID=A0ABQ9GP48_9NEOP|nr:hypothetical protein PR048_024634 [Dryococelus australis]
MSRHPLEYMQEDSSLEKDAKVIGFNEAGVTKKVHLVSSGSDARNASLIVPVDEGSLHKKDEAAGVQDKNNDKQASAGEDKQVKTDEQAASEDKAGADKNKRFVSCLLHLQWVCSRERHRSVEMTTSSIYAVAIVSQVSGDQKAVKDDKDKKKIAGVPAGSSRNLWVSGLSSSTRATDLKQVFSKYGKVCSKWICLFNVSVVT